MLKYGIKCFILIYMSNKTPTIIRLSMTSEMRKALEKAKKKYPTLSDPEILKLGLSKIVTENNGGVDDRERDEIRHGAAHAVGEDYLRDKEEDIYRLDMGRRVHFS